MKSHESLHGAFDDGCYLYPPFTGGFAQHILIVVGHGADEVNRMIPIVVLHDVALEESLEATENQRMYGGFLNVFRQKWRKTCQKTVGERLSVYRQE